jgi:hypothetical protein
MKAKLSHQRRRGPVHLKPGENLTELEKHYLQEQLKHEKLAVAKFDTYTNQLQDPSLRKIVQQARDTSQRHVDSLTNVLKGSGFTVE